MLGSGADPHARDGSDSTPLHTACRRGWSEAAFALLDHGANIYAQNKYGDTPIHLVSHYGQLHALIDRGVDVLGANKYGRTPLHEACSSGNVKTVRLLIDHGADVRAPDKQGVLPLHFACWRGKRDLLGTLVDHGANIHDLCNDGSSPLHYACMFSNLGANIHVLDKRGRTPIHLAALRSPPYYTGVDGSHVRSDTTGRTNASRVGADQIAHVQSTIVAIKRDARK